MHKMSIIEKLQEHLNREKVSFHMPGHKGGKYLFASKETIPNQNAGLLNKKGRIFDLKDSFLGKAAKKNIWKFDTTELSDTDCLQNPQTFLKTAEEEAAKIYGAKHSFFLVNGATCGILAMFFACFKDGDKVIVSRECHKSVINAMIFSGVKPIYVAPKINDCGLSCGADADKIEKAFLDNPDCKGVFITSPTYYGIVSDVKKISEIAHNYGALLLCDEAHGAHFPFSEKFPKGAIKQGADISVVSLHKTLPSPNQTAVLNLGRCKIDRERLQSAVNMFQTTSPSYVLMCAMENALDFSKIKGEKLTEKVLKQIPQSKYIKTFDDPFKIILDFSEKGFDGIFVSKKLEEKFGIYCEMVQHNYVLLIVSWGNSKYDFSCLLDAINYIASLPDAKHKREKCDYQVPFESVCINTPRDIVKKETQKVKLSDATGKIAARDVISFPPCIPLFMPGEIIKTEHIEHIKKLQEEGANISGIEGDCLTVVKED